VADVAKRALEHEAEVVVGDARVTGLPAADVVLLFDVLHLMPARDQETLLSALNRAGVHAPYSCQQGFCGTCRTGVLSVLGGTVVHRDTLLTDPERDSGTMLICISRAAGGSHLTLDL